MLEVNYHSEFKKDYRRMLKRGVDIDKFEEVVTLLIREEELPLKYREHKLKGRYSGYTECHISSDWLLMHTISDGVLHLARTGSHSDLF